MPARKSRSKTLDGSLETDVIPHAAEGTGSGGLDNGGDPRPCLQPDQAVVTIAPGQEILVVVDGAPDRWRCWKLTVNEAMRPTMCRTEE